MDDKTKALLGDHEVAKRLTEAGILLPCPFCGGEVRLRRVSSGYSTSPTVIKDEWTVECQKGCIRNNVYQSDIFQDDKGAVVIKRNGADKARLSWNTRAPILSAEEIKKMEENNWRR